MTLEIELVDKDGEHHFFHVEPSDRLNLVQDDSGSWVIRSNGRKLIYPFRVDKGLPPIIETKPPKNWGF